MLDFLNPDNIGGTIKGAAKVLYILALIGAVISGIAMMMIDEELIVYGLLVMFAGAIVSLFGFWLLYGFGELIERVCHIDDSLRASRVEERKSVIRPAKKEEPAVPQSAPVHTDANAWTCTCGRTHPTHESSCVCGMTKAQVKLKQDTPVRAVIPDDVKVCPVCGEEQRITREVCFYCGQRFDN